MSATVHLILGPPDADPTRRLTEAYRAAAPGTAAILVPTRRHADAFLGQLLDPGHAACLLPRIFTTQSFADEIIRVNDPDLRPLSDLQRYWLLDAVLTELREAGELGPFAAVAETRGFADAAAGAIAEFQAARADLRQLLKVSGRRESSDRFPLAVRLFERYHRKLAKLHRLEPSDRLGRAADHWIDDRRGPFAELRTVIVHGFVNFTQAERYLLDALRQDLQNFWLSLPVEEGEARAETFAMPRLVRAWAESAVGGQTLFDPTAIVEIEEMPVDDTRSTGLRHLVRALFKDVEGSSSADASGLHLIEAPGAVGEARLVARAIRERLADGVPADRVLVVSRMGSPDELELLHEVFDEYGVPHELPGGDVLARVPAVAFLLRAWRLPEHDWPFAGVSAVLRSNYFRPLWPEVVEDPEVAATAEALLRMLGEPRSREAYLAAVRLWQHTPPPRLEDEAAEEPRRQRIQRLAGRCRAFLERFFRAWDRLKMTGPHESFVAGLKAFADELGLTRTADADARDAAGLARLWQELDRWARVDHPALGGRKSFTAPRFARVLSGLTSVRCLARTTERSGRVRVLAAEDAVGLPCEVLFLTGLGEGSWPRLNAPDSLLDDGERERLRRAKIPLSDPTARLGAEQLLFLRLVSQPRRALVLSYAAVDEQGQKLLPSTFLREVKGCFAEAAVPVTAQRMPLDGYFSREPMSAAELRVQAARAAAQTPRDGRPWAFGSDIPLSSDLLANLAAARDVSDARFRARAFGPHDGELHHTTIAADLATRFAPTSVLSPTALETYVACPFQFWLKHVLKLDPLEDPAEEVEHTRRGSAFHRALARLHKGLQEVASGAEVPEEVREQLLSRIDEAVEEYALRTPSPATRELWRLEGQRLKRAAARYHNHWQGFREPWREKGACPKPHSFEADFGVRGEPGVVMPDPLILSVGGIEVRIGGRIDRVDVADLGAEGLGFWIIDYKTGRSESYSPAKVEGFEKLQLPLYAIAVERVLLKDRPARPLGLAYWMVTDTGPKPMLPSGKKKLMHWFLDPARWPKFRSRLEEWVAELVGHVRAGDFPLAPRSEQCTDTCAFGPVCRISQSRATGKVFALGLPVMAGEQGEDAAD